MSLQHQFTLAAKHLLYSRRGEPYRIAGHTLRYVPGTRPIRLRYINSPNGINRYDALQMQLFSKELREGDTVIDIGAHCGQYTLMMAAMCGPTGNVVAFEPDPYARKGLMENLSLNPHLKPPTIEAAAVSDEPGSALLFSRGGNANSSLALSGIGPSSTKTEEIPVPVLTLDAYLEERGLPDPQWVKIDAEGAEIRILKGARRVLSSDARIVCELHPYAWPEFGNTFAELKNLVTENGRRLRYLDQHAEIGTSVEYGTVLIEHEH
jgi:FkbM family methyltransferase